MYFHTLNKIKVKSTRLPLNHLGSSFWGTLKTINCFKVYDIAVMLAGGGDGKLSTSATVLVYYIYQNAFNFAKEYAAKLDVSSCKNVTTMVRITVFSTNFNRGIFVHILM